jgi:phosphoribosylformylglycinamidine cyclo-ligase
VYVGGKKLTDTIDIDGKAIPVGKLVLSPTRTYLPVIKQLFTELRPHLHGMIHCTGGGQTKVVKFIDNLEIIKDNLLPVPPLFTLIQEEAGTSWQEMYQVFNMGQRLEVYLPAAQAARVIAISQSFGIDAQVVGRVVTSDQPKVSIHSPHGQFTYHE